MRSRKHALLLLAACSLSFTGLVSHAADGRFAGSWLIEIEAPALAGPYVARLDIEHNDGKWAAWVENGPAPIKIDGDSIEVEVDSRDRQGYIFHRQLQGVFEDGEISGSIRSVDVLNTAAEYGEDGSAWSAVRMDEAPSGERGHELTDFAGIWVGLRGADIRKYTMDTTTAAKEWVAAYDPRLDEPQKRCVSPGLVAAATWIFPFEILVTENRLTMMYEVYGLSRRVFMDSESQPEFYPESSMGYSTGRFENGEVIIETTLLTRNTRDFNGEPVSENARIVERYFLTNNGSRLNLVMHQHDSENYLRPPIRRRIWDKNPDATIYPFECDPDSFFRQLYNEGLMDEYIKRSPRRQ